MNAAKTNPHGRAGLIRRGFSLIELVVVLVITAIMAGVAIPATASAVTTRQKAAARQIVRDLTFVRERAMASGRTVWVTFNTATDIYTILEESIGSPGRTSATAMTDPATGRAFSQQLNINEYASVDLTGASIGGGSEVGFDWRGRPKVNDATLLTSAATITISGATITIQPDTGLATWQ